MMLIYIYIQMISVYDYDDALNEAFMISNKENSVCIKDIIMRI